MTKLRQDLHFAIRSFIRAPRFTIPALLTLALGIGATSATFSVVRGVMLTPLPYQQPDRIVSVWESNITRNRTRNVISPANFLEWRARNHSFEDLAMVEPASLTLILNGQPEEVPGMLASSDTFSVLGVQPALGRAYTAAEDEEGSSDVLVISDEFWRTRMGGQPSVLGTTVSANGRLRTIIGVMPAGFTMMGEKTPFLMPYGWRLEQLRASLGRGASYGLARLRDGVTLEQASSDMVTIMAALEQEFPARNGGWSATLLPVHEQMVEQIRPALFVLTVAVVLVLLLACVNVANLLLARSTAREQELGLRTALGAARGRIVGQMLSESLLLGVLGGLGGLLVAVAIHRGLLALVADRIAIPRLDQVTLDLPVMLATLGLSLVSGLFFGVVPAMLASKNLNGTLRDSGRHGGTERARRALGTLVVAEVAISLVLLTGAGLLIRSFIRLQAVDPGFTTGGLLTARVRVPSARYTDEAQVSGFFTKVLEKVAVIPGVGVVAAITFLPFDGQGMATSYYRADRPAPADGNAGSTAVRPVTSNWFRTMGVPLVAGRDFADSDLGESAQVAVISQAISRRDFPGENPLGKRVHVSIGRPGGVDYEVVGVVGDIKLTSLEEADGPAVYVPHTQLALSQMTLVVRTDLNPLALVNSVGAAVRSLDPELPLADVRTMQAVVDRTTAQPQVIAVLLSAFALMALLLAGVGVYGVMAYSVAQRSREIGVRMALGAAPESVLAMVMSQAIRLVLAGVFAGLLVAAAFTRLLATQLYETDALDPVAFGGTALLLVVVAALASYVPARRGMRIPPIEALRAD
jgi:predicted permease